MQTERTFVMIKPDGTEKNLIGKCLSRIEKAGLKMIAGRLILMKKSQAAKLYQEHISKSFYQELIDFATSGPCFTAVFGGPESISTVRNIAGPTDPQKAPPGTIRGDFGTVLPFNIIHASDSLKSAKREISIFFRPAEILAEKQKK